MNTIAELIDRAYVNWNTADRLGVIGSELESRSRLPMARKVLARAVELDATGHPEWYGILAFAHFRDTGNLAEEGERILVDGIEATDSGYLKAWHAAFVEEDDIAQQIIDHVRLDEEISAQFSLGHALLWRGRNDEALPILRKTVARLGSDKTPLGLSEYCGAMNWMYAQGMDILLDSEVQPYLHRLIAAFPDVYQYHSLQIQRYQVEKDWEKVQSAAREVLLRFPDEETTMLALATACEKLGNDQDAIVWYNRAIGAKPSYVRARIQLGRLYERLGLQTLAEEQFRDIPTANPTYQIGKIAFAAYLQRTGKEDEALTVFTAAYERLKPYEKGSVEHNPDTAMLVERMKSLSTAR